MSANRRTGTAVLGGANDGTRLRTILARWAECDWLRPLDFAFAEFLWREVPDAPPLLILAAALASHQLGRGHACLDLQATLKDPSFALSLPPEGMTTPDSEPPPRPADVLKGLTLPDWLAAVTHPELVGSGAGATPLVLIGPRLYLRRYWAYEQAVRHGIQARLDGSAGLQATLPMEAICLILNRLFPDQSATPTNWQKLACALAARSAFSIITGGPGTGKTTTVVRLLALLQALALAAPPAGKVPRPLRIRLAAPTGKAAARLNASIAGTVAGLPLDGLANAAAVRAAIPVTVTTLHRLLGSRSDTRRLRHHADNPLALDVLVIDEASMIDLELMAAVLDALPPRARLILLGDKDQLASVEAGAVLGELCRRAGEGHYHPATRDWLATATGETLDPALIDPAGTALDQAIVMLRHSHRFAAAGGIGQLAAAVNAGDTAAALRIWNGRAADLGLVELVDQDEGAFRSLVIDGKVTGHGAVSAASARPNATSNATTDGYRHYLEMLRNGQPTGTADPSLFDTWARAVLEAHGQFQVLCALRRGPWGVEGLNQRIAGLLHAAGLIPASAGWYLGRPVLVTRNDYGLGLMNGDIGITLVRPDGVADRLPLRVAFPAADGNNGITWVLPSRLQAVETVYALTVHKSQGSEFTHAALVMPEQPSPVLTRELIYTGITRARVQLTLVRPGDNQVLAAAIERRVLRASGLMGEH
ncbi:MAG: exodeoxyribonuclease V subunit alpha [Lamprocystis purpurea]|uniref:exodeoxyribonuclease V subunit alpha n=1 Tax=Lamprocystis purpurea TaxID=61598 RepID=UPI0003718898|nr:exodeoxyribonuclease V subunit alpha [Lamprocystis purpurea]MBV5274657.1 exodeoxyribonuclease V subunit alpha [Lamprocystis purpurea]